MKVKGEKFTFHVSVLKSTQMQLQKHDVKQEGSVITNLIIKVHNATKCEGRKNSTETKTNKEHGKLTWRTHDKQQMI